MEIGDGRGWGPALPSPTQPTQPPPRASLEELAAGGGRCGPFDMATEM